jgi:hypothetical protein
MLVMLYLQRFFSSMVEGIALVKPDLAVDSTWPCYTWQTTQFIQGEED